VNFRKHLLQPLQDLTDFLLPALCPLCSKPLLSGVTFPFCSDCMQSIPTLPQASCRRCALPYPTDISDDHLCGRCLNEERPLFDRVITAGIYEDPLKEAIHRFKYRDNINLDRGLSELLLCKLVETTSPDLIIPVPLHRIRLRERTYNQSALLATLLGKKLKRPVALSRLIRHRNTPPQQGQSAADRKKTLKDAFSLTPPLNGESILLVDDVLTTGTTVRECCRVLKENGAGIVTVAVLARAKSY